MNRLSSLAACAGVGLLLTLAIAAPAAAHTSLIDVQPGEGATVAEGTSVTLTFDDELLTLGAEATVTDATGVATALEVTYPTTASVQVVLPALAEGGVTLAWRVVAGDGHPIEGTLAYAAEAPAVPEPTVDPASASPTPSQGDAAAQTPSEAPSPSASEASGDGSAGEEDSSGDGMPVALWIAIFAALLGSSSAIIASKRRS